ncbi:MAG: hypothetical protein KDG50_12980 [Chromatiales bacterium]|nr:hypothetical protein [Chromatiales bacterium]
MTIDSKQRFQRAVLIVAALLSVVAATAAGVYWWDVIVVALLGALAFSKKMFTLAGLYLLLKKFALVLLGGTKKILIGVIGRFLILAAHTRWHALRRLIVGLRWWARRTRRNLRSRWQGLGWVDRTLTVMGAIPLLLIMGLVAVVYMLPKSVWAFLIGRLENLSGAAILERTLPKSARYKVAETHKQARDLIKQKLTGRVRYRDKTGNRQAGED